MATRPWLQGDSDLCRDCQACVLACSLYHEGRCGACMEACPYGAISYNAAADRYLKCDLCAGRERPLCVEICPVGAVTGGQAPGGDR